MAFAPVIDEEMLREIVDAVARIRTVQHVALNDVAHDRAQLSLSLSRPTMLAEELQHALGERVMRCRTDGGSLAVTLHRRASPHAAGGRLFDHVAVQRPFERATGPRLVAPRDFAVHRLTPALIDGALRAIKAVSILVLDGAGDLRAIAGPITTQTLHSDLNIIGRPLGAALTDDVAGPLANPVRQAQRGTSTSTDFPLLDGTIVVRAEISPITDGDHVIGVFVALHQIPARPSAVMTDFSDVFAVTFTRSPVPQALATPDGRIVRSNAALSKLAGRTESELLGAQLRELSQGLRSSGRVEWPAGDQTREARVTRRDGSVSEVVEHRIWATDRNGTPRGLAVQLVPKTDRPATGADAPSEQG